MSRIAYAWQVKHRYSQWRIKPSERLYEVWGITKPRRATCPRCGCEMSGRATEHMRCRRLGIVVK